MSFPLVGGVPNLPHSQSVSIDEYYAGANTFNPRHYDPREWARWAKQARMQYAVLTTKHHDGFTLWPSRVRNPRKPDLPKVSRDLVEIGRAHV